MKKNLLYITTLTMALFFTACGGGDTSTKSSVDSGTKDVLSATDTVETNDTSDLMTPTSSNRDVAMKVGKSYSMKAGESIEKVSNSPKIELNTNTKTGETTATLLEGEAKIKHGRVIPRF